MKTLMRKRKPGDSLVFSSVNGLVMCVIMAITVYPVWFAVVNSLNFGDELVRGYSFLWPARFTFASWRTVFGDSSVIAALWVTTSRTLLVTAGSLLLTSMFAYSFSRPYLKGKKFYVALGLVSMYFSGGLIPFFLLVNWLGLYDNYLVYIFPSLFGGFYNVIIFNANFKAIPASLFEAAKMDGASETRTFFTIVIPLSKPVLAALGVFAAVGTWNDYGTTLFFTQSQSLQTLGNYVLRLIKSSQAAEHLKTSVIQSNPQVAALINDAMGSGEITAKTIELSAMILTVLPVIVAYSFTQKFFEKGVMIGSIKG